MNQPLSRDQIGVSVAVRPGDVFTAGKLSDAIRRLYATGRYRDIQADVQETPDGLILTFKTVPEYFLSQLLVEGVPKPPGPAVLNASTKLELGDSIEDDTAIPAAVDGLREVLRANGFMNPKIDFEVQHLEAHQEVYLRFIVEPGERARFANPEFTGDTQKGAKQLLRTTVTAHPLIP